MVKVSVVVPIYNPGPYLDSCMASLLAQSLDPSEYEILLVDDGSTDDSPALLDELAERCPHVRVFHEENSGWPGRPRNVGIDAARGEYVQFVDQDDELAPETLERMYAMGARNGSDIVLGKVGGTMQGPLPLFGRTIESCSADDDVPLMNSLTPHKMFRRAFLEENKIRFPEGKRRLEDQPFVAKAYLRAKVVSIVGDYVCYRWLRRDDGGNNSSQYVLPATYFGYLREVLDLIVAETEPGPKRDRLMERALRVEMMRRLCEPKLLNYSDKHRDRSYAAVRKLAQDYFFDSGRGTIARLGPVSRLRLSLLEQDRLDSLMELARRHSGDVRAHTQAQRVEVRRGTLRVTLTAELRHRDGRPIVVVERDGRYVLDPVFTADLPGVPEEGWDVGDPLEHTRLDVRVHDQAHQTAWFAKSEGAPRLVPEPTSERTPGEGRRHRIVMTARTRIDPRQLCSGGLEPGGYEVTVSYQALGYGAGARPVGPYGPLTLVVDRSGTVPKLPLVDRIRPHTARVLGRPAVRRWARRVSRRLPKPLVRPLRRLWARLR